MHQIAALTFICCSDASIFKLIHTSHVRTSSSLDQANTELFLPAAQQRVPSVSPQCKIRLMQMMLLLESHVFAALT